MRDYQLGLGIPREQVYNQTMYILVGFLLVGLAVGADIPASWSLIAEQAPDGLSIVPLNKAPVVDAGTVPPG